MTDDLWSQCTTNGDGGRTPTLDQMHETVREGRKIANKYRIAVADALLRSGIVLMRNPALKDHEFMVSPGVYDAAQRLAEKVGETESNESRNES